jgi:hypothetical protein
MPFGLTTGASAIFPREINKIIFPCIREFIFNFIDDILIYSKIVEEHLEHIRKDLHAFKKNKLKINIEKCFFMQIEIEGLRSLGQ